MKLILELMQGHSQLYEFDGVAAEKRIYEPGAFMEPHKDTYPKFSLLLGGSFLETTANGTVELENPSLIMKPNTVLHQNRFGPAGATILSIVFFQQQTTPLLLQTGSYLTNPHVLIMGMQLWVRLKSISTDGELHVLLSDFEKDITALHLDPNRDNQKIVEGERLLRELEVTVKKVADVASELSLHRVYFSRAFKKYYHISPAEFAQCSRLLKAVLLVIHSRSSLTDIAYQTGFTDQSHFNRMVKKRLGCTPQELRAFLKG
jgi:AraC family transcriptional regulator